MTDQQQPKNPYIEPYNHFEGYNEQIAKLRNRPEILSFQKLCYDLFEATEAGKRFMEYVTENFIIPDKAKLGSPTFQVDIIWWDGFKEAYRLLRKSVINHKQYINASSQMETK